MVLFQLALIFGAIALFYPLCRVLLREPKDIQRTKRSPILDGIEDDRQKRGQKAIDNLKVVLSSNYFARSVKIEYTDKTKKYFAVGEEYALDSDSQGRSDIPLTMTEFFYEADEAARKWIEAGPIWIEAGPRFEMTDEALEQTEEEKVREKYCSIFPKDFLRDVTIDYSSETEKYVVKGKDCDEPDLFRYGEEIPIALTDSFYEAEEEAWKWIEAGPRRRVR